MKNVSFLIADDSQSVRSVVKSTIYDQLGSQRILSAVNGLTAKFILQKQAVDVVISDLDMPHLDGFQLLSFIRNHPKLKNTPFIMMASEDSKSFVMDAIEKGVTQYLVKPFTPERLEDAIRRAWYGSEQRRNARISNLPAHRFQVSFNSQDAVLGKIKNISSSGMLFEVAYTDQIRLFNKCRVSVSMPTSKAHEITIAELVYDIVRIETTDSVKEGVHVCNVAINLDTSESQPDCVTELARLMDSLTLEGVKTRQVQETQDDLNDELIG
ncbi:response regulator [Marinomonas posidonica]|uniref:Response regulator receiver protein n=1 Tax=Marinomonas posidonica (strain CECT 7376 / NCIMB 14433 / IVIA-Po-181) TaxID=491952 RepID=F6CZF5_MARPP|nr:response regulator [Marinomonas posidonica]AEF54692.1 response regulator receiver protein [Marinomonas posidonica IVIA-Po-181]